MTSSDSSVTRGREGAGEPLTQRESEAMTRVLGWYGSMRGSHVQFYKDVDDLRAAGRAAVPAPAPSTDLASEQMVELERAVTAAETLVERLKIVEPAMQAAFAALGDEACTYRERVSRATSILSRAMLKVSR